MSNRDIFRQIARACSPDVALALGGLKLCKQRGRPPVSRIKEGAYISPLRNENNPSFSLYTTRDGRWAWQDFATDEYGDMIDLVAGGCKCSKAEAARMIDQKLGLKLWTGPKRKRRNSDTELPNINTRKLTEEAAEQIAKCVGIIGTEGIWRLHQIGMLRVGDCWIDGYNDFQMKDCWFLIDESTKSATTRRLDGRPIGRCKSMTPKGWFKRPIGLGLMKEVEGKHAVLCEGEKDLVAVSHSYGVNGIVPICMPSTITRTDGYCLPHGLGSIRIYAQADRQGIDAALRWAEWTAGTEKPCSIHVPSKTGMDWADLMQGKTESKAIDERMHGSYREYPRKSISWIKPDTYPKAKPHKFPAKQRGSPKDKERDKRVKEAMATLPAKKRTSDTAICRSLGLKPNSGNRTKVRRSMDRLGDES